MCCLFGVLIAPSCGVRLDKNLARYENFTIKNRKNLAVLKIGMSKELVSKIMGNKSIKGVGAFVGNPYKSEVFIASNNETVTVFWYYTQMNTANGHVDNDEITPVVFKDGKMSGYGWIYYLDVYKAHTTKMNVD